MIKINTYIPLVTPYDKNYNIDFLSLEKIISHIISLEQLHNIVIFEYFSEYNTFTINEYIDIINCLINNNISNINIILKINNIYNFNDLINIIDKKIYKNIYNFILDFPEVNNIIYYNDIFNNYNDLFKYYKYLNFFFSLKDKKNLNEDFFYKLRLKNKNFIGIFNTTNYIFKKFKLVNNLDIIINNDLYLFNNIYSIKGISSPLFYFFFNYINNNIILNIQNNKSFPKDKNYYRLLNFIEILYKKINTISGIKFLLSKINLSDLHIKNPIYNFNNIEEYNNILFYYKKILNE